MRLEYAYGIDQPRSIETSTFGEIEIVTNPPVYSPREDSFLLAKAVADLARGKALDMGTGSGLQAIVAAKKKEVKKVTAVDANRAALKCAEKNAERNKVENKIKFLQSNLFESVDKIFDTIIFNPPYLPVEKSEKLDEQSMAWHGGGNGRRVLEPFLDQFFSFLSPNGQLLLLQSSLNGLQKTQRRLKSIGFSSEIVLTEAFFFEKIHVVKAVKN